MSTALHNLKDCRGVTMTETIMISPVFFLLVFGSLQAGQLATAILVANYAASSIARQVVQDGSTMGNYEGKLADLMVAGMKKPNVVMTTEGDEIFQDVKVEACVEVDAFPFVGAVLEKALVAGLGSHTSANCQGIRVLGYKNALPAAFVIHGEATARMNYRPG